MVGSKLRATEPCSSAVLKYPDAAWEGCGVEASPAAPEAAAAAALGEGRAAAPGGEVAARLGRTGEPSTAPRAGTRTEVGQRSPQPPP